MNVSSALKETSRSVVASRSLLGKSLLVVQVAISLVLLVGAGLFLRTLSNLRHVDVAGGQPLENVMLSCKQYTAYWNGKYQNSDREVASGIYLYRLEVDGRAVVKKMIVMK